MLNLKLPKLIAGACFLSIFLSFSLTQSMEMQSPKSYQIIRNVSDLDHIVLPGDLVALDIDETVLKTAADKYKSSPLNLDPKVSALIKFWREAYPALKGERQIQVVFLTARNPKYEKETREQLKQAGFPNDIEIIFAPNSAKDHSSTKGIALLIHLSKSTPRPKRVIMVDDLVDNLKDIEYWMGKSNAYKTIPLRLLLKQTSYKLYESSNQSGYFPERLDNMTYDHPISGGSGGIHVLKSGANTFTFKCVADSNEMKEEILADALYRSLGVPVPEFAVYDHAPDLPEINNACKGTGPYRLARFIPKGTEQSDEIKKAKMQQHFLTDAYLANWDIAVGNYKNTILDPELVLWRIDNGGSLRYRAIGGLKIDAYKDWNPHKVVELETMRDPANEKEIAQVYEGISNEDLKQQAETLWDHKTKLLETVDQVSAAIHVENPQEVKEMLLHRLDDLVDRFKLRVKPHGQIRTEVGYSLSNIDAPATNKTAAGVLIYARDPNGEVMVLLGKRVKHNWWGNLGGKSDVDVEVPDKTLADTAAREVQEESIGLITYAPMSLKNYPSHDLVNPDGVVYRIYIAPYSHVDSEKFMKEAEVEKHHRKREYTDFKWIPLYKIIKALWEEPIIQEEGENTIAIDGLILHPPLWTILKETPVQEALLSIQKNKELRPTHTQGANKMLSPTTFAQEREQVAEQVVHKGQVMGEMKIRPGFGIGRGASEKIETMKGVIPEKIAQKIRKELTSIPLSQSEAHLVETLGDKDIPASSENEVKAFLAYDTAHPDLIKNVNYVNALTAALDTEKQNKDKLVFYHAASAQVSFIYDVYSELHAQLSALSPEMVKSLRILGKPFENILDVDQFILAFMSEGKVSNYSGNYQEMGLSFNPFLFGGHKTKNSETYLFFHKAEGATEFTLDQLLGSFTSSIMPLTLSNYDSLFNQYYRDQNNTKLVQVFIDPQVVDAVAYMAAPGGDPVKIKDPDTQQETYYGFLKTIPQIRMDPKKGLSLFEGSQSAKGEIKELDRLQARLFTKPEVFSRPEFVQIHTYWRDPLSPEQEKQYKTQLRELVAQDIKRALLTAGALKSSEFAEGKSPLKILHEHVEQGLFGIIRGSDKEASPEEKMAMALLDENEDLVAKLSQENPNMDFGKTVRITIYDAAQRKRVAKEQLLYLFSKDSSVYSLLSNNKPTIAEILLKSNPTLIEKFVEDYRQNQSDTWRAGHLHNYYILKNMIKIKSDEIRNAIESELFDKSLWQDSNRETPLHWAVKNKNKELVILLIQKVPELLEKPYLTDNRGITPLRLAVQNKDIDIGSLLIKKAPDLLKEPYVKDNNGDTLLHLAAQNKDKDIGALLIEKAPDLLKEPYVRNKKGNTPLHIAAMNADKEFVVLLLDKAPELVNEKNNILSTPLEQAEDVRDEEIAKILTQHGAIATTPEVKMAKALSKGNEAFILKLNQEYPDLDFKTIVETGGDKKSLYANSYHIYDLFKNGKIEIAELLLQKIPHVLSSLYDQYMAVQKQFSANHRFYTYDHGDNLRVFINVEKMKNEELRNQIESKLLSKEYLKNADGGTLLNLAILYNYNHIINLLVQKKPELVNEKNNQGKTPFFKYDSLLQDFENSLKVFEATVQEKIKSGKLASSEFTNMLKQINPIFADNNVISQKYQLQILKDYENAIQTFPIQIKEDATGHYTLLLLSLALIKGDEDAMRDALKQSARLLTDDYKKDTPPWFINFIRKSLLPAFPASKITYPEIDKIWTELEHKVD